MNQHAFANVVLYRTMDDLWMANNLLGEKQQHRESFKPKVHARGGLNWVGKVCGFENILQVVGKAQILNKSLQYIDRQCT